MNIKTFLMYIFLFTLGQVSLFAQEKIIIVAKTSDQQPFEDVVNGFSKTLTQNKFIFKLIRYNPTIPLPIAEFDKASLVFTIGANPTLDMLKIIKNIPIVFTLIMDPQFSAPNLTGVRMDLPVKEQLDVLSKISPKRKKIGIIYDPSKTKALVETYINESKGKDFEVITKRVTKIDEVYGAMRSLRPSIDCLVIIPDTTVYSTESTADILLYCLAEGLPVVGISPTYVKAGALFSVSCNYENLGKRSGEVATRVLNGEKPSEIPYVSTDKFDTSINLIIARRLGISFPKKILQGTKNVYQ